MKNKLNKIYILGTSGSGKTFLGKIISKKLNLPFYDSDDIRFVKKFTKVRKESKRRLICDKIAKNPKWVLDGRCSSWSREPMKKSDLVIWLQPNIFMRTLRITRRYYKNKGKYEENLINLFRLLKYSWSYRFGGKLSEFNANKKFIEENKINPIVIKNNKQLNIFLERLK